MSLRAALERWANPLHAALAGCAVWLVATCPWISMVTRIRADAGWLTWAHVVLGCATLPLALAYLLHCAGGGRWRLYFGWLAGDLAPLARDLGGLVHGRLPAAEGGGLLAWLEGALLLALVATAATGVGWLLAQGGPGAADWHGWHTGCAWVFGGLALAHLLGVASHWIDFLR